MSALRSRPPEGAGGKGGSVRQTLQLARKLFREREHRSRLLLADLIRLIFQIPPQIKIVETHGSELREYALDAVGRYEITLDFREVPALSGTRWPGRRNWLVRLK